MNIETLDDMLRTSPPEMVIGAVNEFTGDEVKRCRLLLAALLYRIG